jgi:hypothetical protein
MTPPIQDGFFLQLLKFILWLWRERTKLKPRFDFSIGSAQPKGPTMIEITITDEQKIKVTLNPVTEKGKTVTLDGPPSWSIISGESTVTSEADGLSATLTSSDTPGDTQFLVEADADLGSGVEVISDIIQLTVAGAHARNLGLIVGTPELK